MNSSFIAFLPAIFLSVSLLTVYLKKCKNILLAYTWMLFLFIAIVSSLLIGQMETIAVPAIILIATLAWMTRRLNVHSLWHVLSETTFALFALALGLHLIPGFYPPVIYHEIQLSPDAIPYTLYLNTDKTLIGLFIFGLLYQQPNRLLSIRQTGVLMAWVIPSIIMAVVVLSLLSGYIRWEPKIIDHLGLWIWANLLFTCTAEEAFFRGFIQHRLMAVLGNTKAGDWYALLIAAGLFGLAHLGGGWHYAFLAIVAGLGYGLLYKQSGRIEASILGHFSLNLVHILFFTYPALENLS